MRFTVVIPVFRTERFLPRCLDSLKRQTEGDFEVIVVDDASPGHCADVVRPYGDFVRYVRHATNRGAFAARCTGIRAAQGDYIVPVDPDDYLMPETLARLRDAIARDSPDILSYWMDYDDGKKIYPHWCRHAAAVVSSVEALRELVDHRYFTGVASKAFRREMLGRALRALDAPDDLYLNTCDDFLLLTAALMVAHRMAFVDYAGYRYGVNEQSTSFSWKTRAGFRRACEQMRTANGLLLRMARRAGVSHETGTLVGRATEGIAEWFAQMRREASWVHRAVRGLLRTFSAK